MQQWNHARWKNNDGFATSQLLSEAGLQLLRIVECRRAGLWRFQLLCNAIVDLSGVAPLTYFMLVAKNVIRLS